MTDQTPDPIAHLDFPTEMPFDLGLFGQRVVDFIANAPDDVKARIAPHFRPCNTFAKPIDNDLVETRRPRARRHHPLRGVHPR